jgi:negative regulator of flagellin synthesis FlgM
MEIENNRVAPFVPHNSGQGAAVDQHNKKGTDASPGDSAKAGSSADRVDLTGEARQLQQLERQIASQPVVDRQRVETVRSAVQDGTFRVDAERIAEKLMTLEQAVTGTR